MSSKKSIIAKLTCDPANAEALEEALAGAITRELRRREPTKGSVGLLAQRARISRNARMPSTIGTAMATARSLSTHDFQLSSLRVPRSTSSSS